MGRCSVRLVAGCQLVRYCATAAMDSGIGQVQICSRRNRSSAALLLQRHPSQAVEVARLDHVMTAPAVEWRAGTRHGKTRHGNWPRGLNWEWRRKNKAHYSPPPLKGRRWEQWIVAALLTHGCAAATGSRCGLRHCRKRHRSCRATRPDSRPAFCPTCPTPVTVLSQVIPPATTIIPEHGNGHREARSVAKSGHACTSYTLRASGESRNPSQVSRCSSGRGT